MSQDVFNKLERIFLFIDETGDPGSLDKRDASRFYQLNIVVVGRTGLKDIVKHFSRFRYFQDAGRELEKYTRSKEKLCDIFQICFVSLFCLDDPDNIKKRKGPGHSQRAPDPFHLY